MMLSSSTYLPRGPTDGRVGAEDYSTTNGTCGSHHAEKPTNGHLVGDHENVKPICVLTRTKSKPGSFSFNSFYCWGMHHNENNAFFLGLDTFFIEFPFCFHCFNVLRSWVPSYY